MAPSKNRLEVSARISTYLTTTNQLRQVGKRWPGARFIGFSFLLTWVFLTFYGSTWIDWSRATPLAPVLIFIAPNCVSLVVFLACYFRQDLICQILAERKLMFFAGAIASAGDAIMLAATTGLGTACFTAGCIVASFGNSFLTLRVSFEFSEEGPKRALYYITFGTVISLLVWFVAISIPFEYAAALFIVVPFAQSVMYATGSQMPIRKYTQSISTDKREAIPCAFWKFAFMFCVFAAITGVTKVVFTDPSGSYSEVTMLWALLVCVMLLVLSAIGLSYKAVERMYYTLTFAVVLGVLASLIAGFDSPTVFIPTNVLHIIIDSISWCLIVAAASKSRPNRMRIMAFGRFAFIGGGVIGYMLGTFFLGTVQEGNVLAALSGALVILVVIGVTLIFTGKSLSELAEDAVETAPETFQQKPVDIVQARNEYIWHKCERIAAAYNIPPRELEILMLLSHGKGNADISKELCISVNTVRSHVQGVYRKLNVHSRSELAAFIDNYQEA